MISFIAAYMLWVNDAGLAWWFCWVILAMFNILMTVTK